MKLYHFLLVVGLLFAAYGCGTPSLLITPVENTSRLAETTVQEGRGLRPGKILIIPVEGMLINAKSGGFMQPTENQVSLITQELEMAANDRRVAAVVLRVNCPGGTVTSSDTIYQLLINFRRNTGKPIVASSQEVAASGGYYVCCAADRIVVHPTSVVGSVGVIFTTFDIEGTMGKLGVRSEAIKSGALKDMGSPFKHMTTQEREVIQNMVDEYYGRFMNVVTTRRQISDPQAIRQFGDGRVLTGRQAVNLKLADATGSLQDAIELAKKLAGLSDAEVILYKRPYGYSGSIYAAAQDNQPQSNAMQLNLPGAGHMLPTGFYYLWMP